MIENFKDMIKILPKNDEKLLKFVTNIFEAKDDTLHKLLHSIDKQEEFSVQSIINISILNQK